VSDADLLKESLNRPKVRVLFDPEQVGMFDLPAEPDARWAVVALDRPVRGCHWNALRPLGHDELCKAWIWAWAPRIQTVSPSGEVTYDAKKAIRSSDAVRRRYLNAMSKQRDRWMLLGVAAERQRRRQRRRKKA
jgi:hypothetical protein